CYADGVGILPRRDAHCSAERALQMMRAESRSRREVVKIRTRICVRRDFTAHPPDQFRFRAAPALVRMAAPAGAESSMFRRFGHGKQEHLLWMRAARWAGWPAINSSGTDRIDECAIQARVPRRNGREIPSPVARWKNRYPIRKIRHG